MNSQKDADRSPRVLVELHPLHESYSLEPVDNHGLASQLIIESSCWSGHQSHEHSSVSGEFCLNAAASRENFTGATGDLPAKFAQIVGPAQYGRSLCPESQTG